MKATDRSSTGKSWGPQLARLCCGELLGQTSAPDRVEYIENPHAIRFHGEPGYHPIDFPLEEAEPHDLGTRATELVDRYRKHIQREPHRPIDARKP
jgi:hypothetical protein